MKIHLKKDERVIFVGKTGSGKTVLAKYFLKRLNRIFVIDPKHTFRLDGFKIRRSLPMMGRQWKIVYRPEPDDDEHLSRMIYQLFKLQNVTIYCDELATMSERYKQATETLADIARTGREKNVSVWSAVQRPRWVPRVFFTEAESMFIFNLRLQEDRDYMAEFTDPIVKEQIEKYTFWYSHPDIDEIALMRLDISKHYIEKIG